VSPSDLEHRHRGIEILDDPEVDRKELAASLREVARVNFLLGGFRSLLHHLRPLVRDRERISLLDVGVGNGEVSRRLARRLGRGGRRVRWVGLDLHAGALAVARERPGADSGPGGPEETHPDTPPPRSPAPRRPAEPPTEPFGLVRADARALPFPDRSFDVAHTTLTLHHFEDPDCRRVLREMARVSRTAVLVSDLERTHLHLLGARLLSATWWRRDRITRHDAPVSVLRAFRAEELGALAEGIPFRSVRVRRHFPFRLVLECRI